MTERRCSSLSQAQSVGGTEYTVFVSIKSVPMLVCVKDFALERKEEGVCVYCVETFKCVYWMYSSENQTVESVCDFLIIQKQIDTAFS